MEDFYTIQYQTSVVDGVTAGEVLEAADRKRTGDRRIRLYIARYN